MIIGSRKLCQRITISYLGTRKRECPSFRNSQVGTYEKLIHIEPVIVGTEPAPRDWQTDGVPEVTLQKLHCPA